MGALEALRDQCSASVPVPSATGYDETSRAANASLEKLGGKSITLLTTLVGAGAGYGTRSYQEIKTANPVTNACNDESSGG